MWPLLDRDDPGLDKRRGNFASPNFLLARSRGTSRLANLPLFFKCPMCDVLETDTEKPFIILTKGKQTGNKDDLPQTQVYMSPVRILVVEDNESDQELLRRELRRTPFGEAVLFLPDPREAIKLLTGGDSEQFRSSLIAIFLDVHLPHMTGIDLLRIIRRTPGIKDFPVVVMTSCPSPSTIDACKELRVRAFLEKPVRLNHFSTAVAELFHAPRSPSTESS